MKKAIGTAFLAALIACPPPVLAAGIIKTTKVTCFCKASSASQSFQPNPSAVIYDMTGSAALTFTGSFGVAHVPANMGDCRNKCRTVAINEKSQIAAAACARNIANDSWIHINHTLGTRPYFDTVALKLINKPASPHKEWICPSPWHSNTSNQVGGITTDGRCKKLHGTYTGPAFPNGTQLGGNSAFTWGNEIWVYGTSANGGAAVYQQYGLQVDPAICDLQT